MKKMHLPRSSQINRDLDCRPSLLLAPDKMPRSPKVRVRPRGRRGRLPKARFWALSRSEEHTSELQSRRHLVCRLLLEQTNAINARILPKPRVTSHCEPPARSLRL